MWFLLYITFRFVAFIDRNATCSVRRFDSIPQAADTRATTQDKTQSNTASNDQPDPPQQFPVFVPCPVLVQSSLLFATRRRSDSPTEASVYPRCRRPFSDPSHQFQNVCRDPSRSRRLVAFGICGIRRNTLGVVVFSYTSVDLSNASVDGN